MLVGAAETARLYFFGGFEGRDLGMSSTLMVCSSFPLMILTLPLVGGPATFQVRLFNLNLVLI